MRGRSISPLLLVLLIMVLSGAVPTFAPGGFAGPPSSTQPTLAGTVGGTPEAPYHALAHVAGSLAPRGQATPTCQDPNVGVDLYDPIVGSNGLDFWPLYPYDGGYPCPLTSQDPNAPTPFNDELHATFSSEAAGSASRWTVP
ncbi:MAG TPA: hypothetical protein VGS23_03535, partial [Thermoplasmata archaeon]|nr:hypothetical protein [Thermoplasmata archaeon]